MTIFHERDLLALLLVRAVEEQDPSFFSPEALSESALAASDSRDDRELLEKRTSYLFLRLPRAVRAWGRVALFPENSIGLVVGATFLFGLISNYLGPSGQVHVAYNPLAFLIVWNFGVYASLVWRWLRRGRTTASIDSQDPLARAMRNDSEPCGAARASPASRQPGGLTGLLVGNLWLAWNKRIARLRSASSAIKNAGKVVAAFWDSYWDAASRVAMARVEALLHAGAIGLFFGALVGTYVRGFFFEYKAVWRSTFLTEPDSVAVFLNVLFGPACAALDGVLLNSDAVRPLLLPEGTIAAAWIHRLASMGALTIFLPRGILAVHSISEAQRESTCIGVDLSDDYYAKTIVVAREGQVHRIRDRITTTIRSAVGSFSESVALFVRDQFFDKKVAPTLFSFRNKGGRVADLETELANHTVSFEPKLASHLRLAQTEFQRSVRLGVQSAIRRELSELPTLGEDVSSSNIHMDSNVTGSVAGNVGDAIGATVTAAVTAAIATISGGLGKSLGVAILSGLLGTSGPIGLLLGGLAAAVVVGGAYFMGRDSITTMVKQWYIPAPVAALALRDAKLTKAREATYTQVKREILGRVEPLVGDITESTLKQLSSSMMPRRP